MSKVYIVTVLDEGQFRLKGVLFCRRIPVFVEECVLISSRSRWSSISGVGGQTLLWGGVPFDLEEGVYIIWSRGSHTIWRIKEGCFDLKEGSSSSEVGGDTLVGRGCI